MTAMALVGVLFAAQESLEAKVLPLLEARCFRCHSSGAKLLKGGLRLDAREAILKGGQSGKPAVVPGEPERSPLILAVRRTDPELAMPPKEKLPDGEVELLARWVAAGAPFPAAAVPRAKPEKPITDADRAFWSFRPVARPPAPGARNPIDGFIRAEAPEADRAVLIRRATFDLHGLPPAPGDVAAFVADPDPEAYAKLVDRLLESPRYGERWGRRWLDLVRYAESDGYKQDAYRPDVWPYRDWVIRSLNQDKPYDRFIAEQLAGDELAPDDPSVRVATTFLRLGIFEYNQRHFAGQRDAILNDLTDMTGDVFLGLGMGCARCHDHKYDPILQSDYYRLRAFFEAIIPRDDLPLTTAEERARHAKAMEPWLAKTAEVRAKIAQIEEPYRRSAEKNILIKFLPEYLEIYKKADAERTPLERQLAYYMNLQVVQEGGTIDGKIKGPDRETWSALKRELAAFAAELPPPLQGSYVAGDIGPEAPPTYVLGSQRVVAPGFLTVLGAPAPEIVPLPQSTGRRSALAAWLTRPDHPLVPRVIVNRLWAGHFGLGLVATPSDFGRLGTPPTHPELLDWLAARLVEGGWKLKPLHKLMMTSAAYRQGAREGSLMSRRRLEAEEVRDAMLAVSGELVPASGGPAVDASAPRRSVYTKVMRNAPDPLLAAFDGPDTFISTPARNVTTTPTQALLMINGPGPLARAEAFARRLAREEPSEPARRAALAYRLAYGREPKDGELAAALAFLSRGGKPAAAAAAGPLTRAMPHRGGQAILIRNGAREDMLRLSEGPAIAAGDFTVEAVVQLDSTYENAEVRVIVSQWSGAQEEPGWSLGVTSLKSRHQPQNLILQVVGPAGYRVIASDLRVELDKTYYVAAAARPTEGVVSFWARDLTDPEAPLRAAEVRAPIGGPIATPTALIVGGRAAAKGSSHGWDGLIDEVRLSTGALALEQLLVQEAPAAAVVSAHWKFEEQPGCRVDSAGRQQPLEPVAQAKGRVDDAALLDFCHALLNSSEFLYVD